MYPGAVTVCAEADDANAIGSQAAMMDRPKRDPGTARGAHKRKQRGDSRSIIRQSFDAHVSAGEPADTPDQGGQA
mgnify:CR=1 FL=1